MADVERALISKTIQAGELPDVIARGVKEEHFADPEVREVWDYSLDFWRRHKETPSPAVIRDEFPDFGLVTTRDPVSYHLERFVRKVKERAAIDLVREYHTIIEDPDMIDEIELYALEMARQLTEMVPAPRATRFSDKSRYDDYKQRQEAGEILGILLGIPTIDAVMLGLQPHEIATIVAYMGVGKSILMQHIAYSAYLQHKTSLLISLEMEAEAILRRIDVMATNFKYHALKALELGVGDEEQWKRMLERAHEERHERDIIVRDDIPNCTADNVMAETMRYQPDLVLVDYLELMKVPKGFGASHWEAVSHAGQALKQSARILKIPHITAAQLSREGSKKDNVTLANVGYQSIGKHSDVVVGLAQDDEMEASSEMDVLLLKMRDGKKTKATMRWALETMDIREKGVEERFPEKGGKKKRNKALVGRERRQRQHLEVKRTMGDRRNPWHDRAKGKRRSSNPFTQKAAA